MLGLEIAEVVLGFIAVGIGVIGSWSAMRVKVGRMEERLVSVETQLESTKENEGRDRVDILHLSNMVERLDNDGKEYRQVLRSLNTTLAELNITLGRMDERMKNVENYISKD